MGLDSSPVFCLETNAVGRAEPTGQEEQCCRCSPLVKEAAGGQGGWWPGPVTDSPLVGGRCGASRLSIVAVPGGGGGVGRVSDTLGMAESSFCLGHSALPGPVPLPYQDMTLLSTLLLW